MTACIAEIFADSSSRKRRKILQGSRIGSGSGYHNRIIHRAFFAQYIYKTRHRRPFLSYSDIDTIYRITCLIIMALVDNGINRNGGLTCLAVADNQLTLPASDRYHRINRFQPCLQRLGNRLAEDYSRRFALQRHLTRIPCDFATPVQRHA